MSKLRSNEFINVAGDGAPSFPQGVTSIEPTIDSQVATKSYVESTLTSVLGQPKPSLVAPTNPKIGSFWVDTSVSPSLLKTWNGNIWLEFSGSMGGAVSISEIATPEILSPVNYNGFPDLTFAPLSSPIKKVTNVSEDSVRLVIEDDLVSNSSDGSIVPGVKLSNVLSVGDSVYHSSSSAGQHNWIATFHDPAGDSTGEGVACDSSGNVYVTGHIHDGSTVGILLAKYDPAGSLKWQRRLSGTNHDYAYGIAVDTLNNIFISGETRSGGAGGRDFFIAKYDTDGNIQWQRRLGDTNTDTSEHIAVDNLGNAYAVGYVTDGQNSIFVVKYDTDGNLQWQHELTSAAVLTEQGLEIAVDALGNSYVTGHAQEGGTTAAILAKYDTNGNLQWQRKLYGTNNSRGYGIAVHALDSVYLGIESKTGGDTDIVIAKYDTDGNIQWQRKFRGPGSGTETPQALSVDAIGNVYIAGSYYARTSSIYSGRYEYLIAKYDTNGNLQWYRMLYGRYNDLANGMALDKFGNICITGYSESVSAHTERTFVTAKLPGDGSGIGVYGDFTYETTTGWDPDLVSEVATLTELPATMVDSASSYAEVVTTFDSTTSSLDSAIISMSGSSGIISEISGNTITLSDVSGTWSTGMKLLSQTLSTLSGGTPTSTLTLTSSTPTISTGLIGSWGNAEWQLAEDSEFTTNLQSIISPIFASAAPTTYTMTTSAQPGDYLLTGSDRSNTFTGDADPSITLFVGDTLTFDNTATYSSHPMYITTSGGVTPTNTTDYTATLTSGVGGYTEWLTVFSGQGILTNLTLAKPNFSIHVYAIEVDGNLITSGSVTSDNGWAVYNGVTYDGGNIIDGNTETKAYPASTGGTITFVPDGGAITINSQLRVLVNGPNTSTHISEGKISTAVATIKTTPFGAGATNEGTPTVSWEATTAGTYYYQCDFHPTMVGTITVLDGTQSGPDGFVVDPNNPYYVRVKYDVSNPTGVTSPWSDTKYFKIVE